MNLTRIVATGFAILLATHASAQGCHNLNAVTVVGQDLLQQSPLFGRSCVSIEQHGVNVYSQCFGSLNANDVIPIASATKTLSAAVLMSLVDAGLLALDDRVGQYLPEWDVGTRAQITLRMCFAHTSGLPDNDPAVTDASLTLRQAAFQLASVPLEAPPGTAFAYGNVSMHVAGAVCEVVTGQSWTALFQQRIAQPLGMTSTDFGDPTTASANPLVAGGARSTRADFAVFMSMLRANGLSGGVQVLSPAAVDTMLQDQTAGTVMVRNVHPDQVPYGLASGWSARTAPGRRCGLPPRVRSGSPAGSIGRTTAAVCSPCATYGRWSIPSRSASMPRSTRRCCRMASPASASARRRARLERG